MAIVVTSSAGADEAISIDGGFAYANVEFATMLPYEMLGTMTNQSGRGYKSSCFMVKLYGQDDRLLKTVDFCIPEFASGQSKLFRVNLYANPAGLKGYKIQFLHAR